MQKIIFLDPWDQNKILNFLDFLNFNMGSISYINLHFRAPNPLKPLKSSLRYQYLPGVLLTAHSDQKNGQNRPKSSQKSTYVDSFSYISLSWIL